MSSPDFCEINSNFDSNMYLWGYASFATGKSYIARVVVDGWEKTGLAASNLMIYAKAVAYLLATVNDLALYRVKGIAFNQVPRFQITRYYKPTDSYTPFGSGCTDAFIAGEGTWTIDIVFEAKNDERTFLHTAEWRNYLANALSGSLGRPTVYVGGLVELVSGSVSGSQSNAYEKTVEFWRKIQPFWEILKVPSEVSSTGYKGQETAINRAPAGQAWDNLPYVGHRGYGICYGDAFDPDNLRPLAPSGSIIVSPGKVPVSTDPNDPNAWVAPVPTVDTDQASVVTSQGKMVAVGIAGVAAFLISKYIFDW